MTGTSLARALGWLAAALLISLGAGGVAVADRPPGDLTRPELTVRADGEVARALEPMLADLDELQVELTRLAGDARRALGELNARDVPALREAIADGTARLERIARLGGRIGLGFDALPYSPDSPELGERARSRLVAIDDSLRALAPVRAAWQELAARATPAAQLLVLLERHDERTFAATQAGANERYARALELLEGSLADLDRATEVRDRLVRSTDVETLDDWIARNRAYDEALAALYGTLQASGGEVTDEVREAFAEVQRRQELLPPDTRALVVIVADIAQGGLNQAAIVIEEARGRLSDATERLH